MNRGTLLEPLALLAVPPLAFWLMHFEPIAQNGTLDPYIYTGYIHNFVDLFERYGATYYGVRFGMILPAQLTTTLFGAVPGYFVLRYLLALLAGVPFYVLVRQRHGRQPAIAAFLLLMTSPWLARTLLWDYPDATGVTFLFAAICLFSIEDRRRRLLDACAGVCAGMAIHSNIFVLAPLGIYLGAYALIWVWFGRGIGSILRRLSVLAAAVVAVSALGVLYYWWRVGHADIFSITVQMVSELLGGDMAGWRVAGVAWVATLWWALVPPALVLLATVVCAGRLRGSFHEWVVWTSAFVTTAFYYLYQFVLNGTFLQLSYYFSYALPAMFLLLASIIGALWERATERARWVGTGLLLMTAAGPWVLYSFDVSLVLPERLTQYAAIVAVALVAVIVWRWRPHAMTSLLATAALGLVFFSSFAPQPYVGMVSNRQRPAHLEMDVYRTALRFMTRVPTVEERPGIIRFWYSHGPSNGSIDSIQSTYLWGFSKLQTEGSGMPQLGMPELEILRRPRVRWLALLAHDADQLARGREALLENGVQYASIDRHVFREGSYTLHFELLDLLKGD